MSQLGETDYVGISNNVYYNNLKVLESFIYDEDQENLPKTETSKGTCYIVGKFVDPIYTGVRIPGFCGNYILLDTLSESPMQLPMDNLFHHALAISTKARGKDHSEAVQICLLQYNLNEWVLGYRWNDSFWMFEARVYNQYPSSPGYNEHPDIIVKPIEDRMAFFVTSLPPGYHYVLLKINKDSKILYIHDEKMDAIKPASL